MACSLALLALAFGAAVFGRQPEQVCGTGASASREERFLHERHRELRRRIRSAMSPAAAAAAPDRTTVTDAGDIVLMDDQGGTVGKRNPFGLDNRTVTFRPVDAAASKYTFAVSADSYDAAASDAGGRLSIGDQESVSVNLPFAFPFFGKSYTQIYVNSDGNLTFGAADPGPSDLSFGRFSSTLPRIAPLFADLDPSVAADPAGVRVKVEAGRVVITWAAVPVYASFGFGKGETFQVRLAADGVIDMAFHGIDATEAVVGISPGALVPAASLISLATGSSEEFAGAVGERFSSSNAIDVVAVSQKFYELHQDAFDYLVIYNTMNIPPSPGAVAQEFTVRNDRSGYGDTPVADGPGYGSPKRLQAVLHMGYTTQYPLDPNATVPARGSVGDTPLSILGHEAGHLFLAFVSVKDPLNPTAKPMLGRGDVHWSFFYNSEASLLEGNRLTDYSPASPQFASTGTVQQYSPLDQYLMGLRAAEEVPDTFWVADPTAGGGNSRPPQLGVAFDGTRRNVRVQDVIAVAGRRTPDATVAQRNYRFAFILVYPKGTPPTTDQIAQVEKYRAQFPEYYARVTGNRATAETGLKLAVQFNGSPALGVVQNQTAKAVISLQYNAGKDVVFTLRTPNGVASAPATVTIAAGEQQVAFEIRGLKAGVEDFVAVPSEDYYETARAKINVQSFAFFLKPV
ncbi:MAG: hypothetical protein ABI823_18935, partial [Bryobacteraceae bacterium]